MLSNYKDQKPHFQWRCEAQDPLILFFTAPFYQLYLPALVSSDRIGLFPQESQTVLFQHNQKDDKDSAIILDKYLGGVLQYARTVIREAF